MIAQLMEQKLSRIEAVRKVNQIEAQQVFNFLYAAKQRKQTVGSYFKTHKSKCLKKFKSSSL